MSGKPSRDQLAQMLLGLKEGKKKKDLLQKLKSYVYEAEEGADSGVAKKEAAELERRFHQFTQQYEFHPGQLVRWKEGLKHKRYPFYNQPAIVMAVLQQPVLDSDKDSGTPYFREPLDLVLGMSDEDGDFVIFHFDSRRFEPLPSAE